LNQRSLIKRLALSALVIAGALGVPLWAAAAPDHAGPVSITLEFDRIPQGDVGIVRVNGTDITAVRAVFQERVFNFYQDGRGWVGLISADMESEIQPYTMQLWIQYSDGAGERVDQPIEVGSGGFGSSDVVLSASLMPLLELDVEEAEMERLFDVMDRFTPARYWEDQGFIIPSDATQIGWFGTWRLYNSTYWRRHTGLDIRMPIGTPVIATASGRVMLAEEMAIRGGYVLIDHGWGVYSGYAHLSEKLVVPGQWVRQGDVIGLSGLNGRSAGAHLHWEIAVGGTWVDPEAMVALDVGE